MTVALVLFGSSSGQRRTKVRVAFLRAADALVIAMKPPARMDAVPAPQTEATPDDTPIAIPAEFMDDRGYMLPWSDIIDIITASLRGEADECAI